MTVEDIPKYITDQANALLSNGYYSHSKFARDVLKRVLGMCAICDKTAEKLVTEKQDTVQVIEKYCEKCYIEKYQKYAKKKRRKKVRLS